MATTYSPSKTSSPARSRNSSCAGALRPGGSPRNASLSGAVQAVNSGSFTGASAPDVLDALNNLKSGVSRLFAREFKAKGPVPEVLQREAGIPAQPQVTTTRPKAADLPLVPQTLEDAVKLAQASGIGLTANVWQERAEWVEDIEGQIPAGLKGTLIRNGPGLFEVGGKEFAHPFDGDGHVYSFNFDGTGNDGVWFNNKFVRTHGFVEERTEGVQKYRGTFNRNLPENEKILSLNLPLIGKVKMINPLDMEVKDAANTNVVSWGGKILALHERGVPHMLSNDLKTIGTTDLEGSMQGEFMGAHVRMHKEADGSGRLTMFSVENDGLTDATAMFHEYDTDFNLVNKTSMTVPGAANGMYHDMAVSENYYIIVQNRLQVDFVKLFVHSSVGQASLAECLLHDRNQPVKVHLIPRPGRPSVAGGVRSFEVPGGAFFTHHLTNAFETKLDGNRLVLDLVCAKEMDFSKEDIFLREEYYGDVNRRTEPCRISINLDASDPSTAVTKQRMAERFAEMPAVHPNKVGKPQEHVYYVSSTVEGGEWFGPNQGILKMSVDPMNGVAGKFDASKVKKQFWQPASSSQFVGEPVFVPREGGTAEDDGFVMTLVFDAEHHKSQLVILDAQQLQHGPLATIKLAHHLPIGLHGMWTGSYLGPAKGTPNQEPYDIRDGV